MLSFKTDEKREETRLELIVLKIQKVIRKKNNNHEERSSINV